MRLPEIYFGMYFVKYIKKVNVQVALISFGILTINTILSPSIDKNIQTTYIGIASFLLLVYIGSKVESLTIKKVCGILSNYSYAVFLTHHYIIYQIASRFDLNNITILESYLLFCLCCIIIALFSKLLYDGNDYIVKAIQKNR